MNENVTKIYLRFARYSLWIGLIGLFCCLTIFPDGIYYGFFCGVMAIALAVISRHNATGSKIAAGVIVGIIDIVLSIIFYYGLYLIYSLLLDPVAGSQLTAMLSDILAEYGMTIEMFSSIISH